MTESLSNQLLDAAVLHVPFDGWTDPTFKAAVADVGVDMVLARGLFPRGALDLAIAYHKRGDAEMIQRFENTDTSAMKIREKVTSAVRARIEAVDDREVVRRGTVLFALPQNAPEGAKLIWGTADAIWGLLGDTSRDINWYSKRATLSAVYSSTVLFWLGDDSAGYESTWAFLDRRIEDVMRIEKAKAQVKNSPFLSKLMAGPAKLFESVKAPDPVEPRDLPGGWTAPR